MHLYAPSARLEPKAQNGLWAPPPVDQLVDGHDAVDDAVAVAQRAQQKHLAPLQITDKGYGAQQLYHRMLGETPLPPEPRFVMRQAPISESGQMIVFGEIFDDLLALSFEGLI